MVGRIVEVASNGGHVALERGFLTVTNNNQKGKIAIDDIDAVIASAFGITYTNAVLTALAERGAPLIICGNNYSPTAILISLDGHYAQAKRIAAQAQAGKPKNKQIWSQVVRAKITAQYQALKSIGNDSPRLLTLSRTVKSGDPNNNEAQASQFYWRKMMGDEFRRNPEKPGLNAFLNYGYAVLRAASARAIAGAGLHPSLSIHHESAGDALRLADDLMEPFRPSVDILIRELWLGGETEMTPAVKIKIASILTADFKTDIGITPLSVCLSKLANSLTKIYLKETNKLALPNPLIPILDND